MNKNGKKDGQNISQMLLAYRDVLFSYIMALVRDVSEAEELFQETALVILNKEKEGIQVKHFGSWSREIARRKILEYWNAGKTRKARFLSAEALDALDTEFNRRDEAGGERIGELLQRLKQCIRELPEHLRRCIDFRYSHGLSFREIGKKLRRSAGTAQVMLSRIRQKLLDCVERLEKTEGAARNGT